MTAVRCIDLRPMDAPRFLTREVRSNLDVKGEYGDEDLWGVLDKVNLRSVVQGFDSGKGLDHEVRRRALDRTGSPQRKLEVRAKPCKWSGAT